jgi:NAD(P)-dependent dehydrogenase (short-subunit alcohol dehydrogenase family)
MTPLRGRTALVTGGGRGIGAAAAGALAVAGALVGVAARNMDQVVEVAARLRDAGHEVFAFRCDVTLPMEVRDMALSAAEAMGRIDILVNNAGTATSDPLHRVSIEAWNHLMAVNATGTFLCTKAVMSGMRERGWGRVVNVASVAGLEGAPYISAYTAAKHAVVGFTRAVAEEVAGSGVTVNAVCPGYVDTPLTRESVDGVMRRSGLPREEALQAILRQAGQPRLIEAHDVADCIVDLCGTDADGRNGEIIVIDGKDERA